MASGIRGFCFLLFFKISNYFHCCSFFFLSAYFLEGEEVDHSQQLSTNTAVHSLPTSRIGKRIRRAKVRKLMGRDKDGLEVKERLIYFSKSDRKAVTHVLPQTVKCPASLQAMVTLENETPRFCF